jgi:hypothetical protein
MPRIRHGLAGKALLFFGGWRRVNLRRYEVRAVVWTGRQARVEPYGTGRENGAWPFVLASFQERQRMKQIDLILPMDACRHDEGFCWVVELPSEVAPGDDSDNHDKSDLQLWEGDKLLGPAHAVHSRIRKLGGGLYSHWGRKLFLSSAVADEPVASGLAYRIRA